MQPLWRQTAAQCGVDQAREAVVGDARQRLLNSDVGQRP